MKKANKTSVKIDRRYLVETLENLLSDEFDSSELVYETEAQLIERIIQAANYYRDEYHEKWK
jgi:hypothetical protein